MDGEHQISDLTTFETMKGWFSSFLFCVVSRGFLYIGVCSPAGEEVSLGLCHNLSLTKSRVSSAFLGISYKELNSESIVSTALGWKKHWMYQMA